MVIGDRLRSLREQKNLSQGDIERRAGLLRCSISRVGNDHAVSSIGTLEKMARAIKAPLYQSLYDGEEPPKLPLTSRFSDHFSGEGTQTAVQFKETYL
jgi:transcriptional regulator with XRE-family HTH domain